MIKPVISEKPSVGMTLASVLGAESLSITGIEREYMADTKGFYRPVYRLTAERTAGRSGSI